jgi:hypothetical protein
VPVEVVLLEAEGGINRRQKRERRRGEVRAGTREKGQKGGKAR